MTTITPAGVLGTAGVKAAVAATADDPIVKLQVTPLQAPLQFENAKPLLATAVKVIAVPLVKAAEQVPGQFIPAGELVTVPPPVGVIVTVTVFEAGGAKVAVTDSGAELIVKPHAPDPVHWPPQPTKLKPPAGVSAKDITVPEVKLREQVGGQEIPLGVDVMVPELLGETVTVSVPNGVG